jgi:hypothetical protein
MAPEHLAALSGRGNRTDAACRSFRRVAWLLDGDVLAAGPARGASSKGTPLPEHASLWSTSSRC